MCIKNQQRAGSRGNRPVDLETKTVVIEEEKDYGKAVEILDDLGFTAVEQQ
mgnify:CR=1 FL=1